MAGKVKASPLSYQYLVTQHVYAASLAPTGVPSDDTLKLRIHLALLQRLRVFHMEEYRYCIAAIARIAKYEAADAKYLSSAERAHGIEEQLTLIAATPLTRATHDKYCIALQQTIFRDCFTQEHYLEKCTASSRLIWFRAHWDQLTAMTALTPCCCQFRTGIDEFRVYAALRPYDLVTIANASDFFLAFTHGLKTVSAENLRKCLKTKP